MASSTALIKIFLSLIVILITVAYVYSKKYSQKNQRNTLLHNITLAFAIYALLQIGWIGLLWINHASFPLNLEAMELAGLQHLKRILSGLPLYPAPSSSFIALAYNPLYYYLCVPFSWLFGPNLLTMRLVAIIGMAGSGLLLFAIVRRETQSNWWGLMAIGLFAAAYRAMDTYLDNAHRGSWLLCSILLGCYWIDLNRSRLQTGLGILLLVSAFWFKQQGAVFLLGGLCYLTWRDGWRQT